MADAKLTEILDDREDCEVRDERERFEPASIYDTHGFLCIFLRRGCKLLIVIHNANVTGIFCHVT